MLKKFARKVTNNLKSLQTMKPKIADNHPDLFRSQLSQILNLSHPLCRLAEQINWQRIEKEIDVVYSTNGPGHPALPTRLLAGLHYLKYTFNESDESVVDRWVENPYWQYLSGMKYFSHELPCNSSSMTRWRKRIGESGAEKLLRKTIEAGLKLKVIKKER